MMSRGTEQQKDWEPLLQEYTGIYKNAKGYRSTKRLGTSALGVQESLKMPRGTDQQRDWEPLLQGYTDIYNDVKGYRTTKRLGTSALGVYRNL